MRLLTWFTARTFVDVANYAGWPLLTIYGISMFAFPWLAGGLNWQYVQDVWDRWQTFNAGALAFVASLVAFNISKFNDNQQRKREFTASKAFLPLELSSLMEYCASSARLIEALWKSPHEANPVLEAPRLPQGYREVFSSCIRHASPEVGNYLSAILVRLQIHDSRLRDAIAEATPDINSEVDRYSLLAYLLRLGELYSLIGNLFEFARGEKEFSEVPLVWENYRNSYAALKLEIDDFYIDDKMNLEAFTKRRMASLQNSGLGLSAGDA